jgi:hypothetical protein
VQKKVFVSDRMRFRINNTGFTYTTSVSFCQHPQPFSFFFHYLQAYLYDLAAACPALLKSSEKYPVLKRLFYQTLDRSNSMFPLSDQIRDMIAPYISQPNKKKVGH